MAATSGLPQPDCGNGPRRGPRADTLSALAASDSPELNCGGKRVSFASSVVLASDGLLSRADGALLLAAFAAAIAYLARLSRRGFDVEPGGEVAETLGHVGSLISCIQYRARGVGGGTLPVRRRVDRLRTLTFTLRRSRTNWQLRGSVELRRVGARRPWPLQDWRRRDAFRPDPRGAQGRLVNAHQVHAAECARLESTRGS